MDIIILCENSRHVSVIVSFCFHLQECAYKEFGKPIYKSKFGAVYVKLLKSYIIEGIRTNQFELVFYLAWHSDMYYIKRFDLFYY